ncbi:MAG TPA: site-specific integrase [Euzebya sp.]|nr:site-specific integrase [Euzebya sp.]
MASIVKRDGRAKPWQVRYRDPSGESRSRQFARQVDAKRFAATIEADMLRGAYVDPAAGKVTLRAFAEEWLARQTFEESTRESTESRLNAHILPGLGDLEVRSIRPSTIQAWLRGRQAACAPRYVRVMLANLSSILSAAVEDGLIARNPCASSSVRSPAHVRERVIPWTGRQVAAVIDAHPAPYQGLPVLAAGCGLRQGECFGLSVEDVDFLGRTLHVRQQVKIVRSQLVLAPPKGRKVREVPLPDVVAEALAERIRVYPPAEDGLIFTSREHKPINRNYYNPNIWKPALVTAGVEPTRVNGMHALRHYFASVLLDAGETVRALAEYLGHADPGFTLRTYTHLMPASEDRTRRAVDDAFRSSRAPDVHQVSP